MASSQTLQRAITGVRQNNTTGALFLESLAPDGGYTQISLSVLG
jgi:hypothetical protein